MSRGSKHKPGEAEAEQLCRPTNFEPTHEIQLWANQ